MSVLSYVMVLRLCWLFPVLFCSLGPPSCVLSLLPVFVLFPLFLVVTWFTFLPTCVWLVLCLFSPCVSLVLCQLVIVHCIEYPSPVPPLLDTGGVLSSSPASGEVLFLLLASCSSSQGVLSSPLAFCRNPHSFLPLLASGRVRPSSSSAASPILITGIWKSPMLTFDLLLNLPGSPIFTFGFLLYH